MTNFTKSVLVWLAVFLIALLGGCGNTTDTTPLRIAVLPILDALPLFVAQQQGYFADEGVKVDLVSVSSAAERDQLLQAGQIDGMITDLVALALYNHDATQVIGLRYAMVPTEQSPQFRILASAASGYTTPADLAGVPVGVSEGTVIEYVTDRLLAAAGVPHGEIQTLAVPRIPDRMSLLNAGDLAAATLPEPLGSLAMQQGATLILDDSAHPEYSCSLYAMRADVVRDRNDAVSRFVRAIDRASTMINADKEHWSDLLSEQQIVPAPLVGSYVLPDYPGPEVATSAQFADVLSWLQDSGRLDTTPLYEDSITDAYLHD